MRVLHLVGSARSEYLADLSALYARACLEATADPARYEPHVAVVSPDGSWRFPASLDPDDVEAVPPVPLAAAVAHLAALEIDVAVPQMFCLPGMTSYRALLDLLGVPYVGNLPETMAAGAVKSRARAMVAAAGVDAPAAELLRRGDTPTLAPPVVVKPDDADNSWGVTLVRDADRFDAALEAAFAHSSAVLVEQYVAPGREVRCGMLETEDGLVGLPLEEYRLDADDHPIRGEADKLARDDDGALRLVAKDNPDVWILDSADPLTARVHAVARAAHVALGCRDYSLIDLRIDADGRPWFLEAGLYCSYAPTSVIATMADAAGISLDELFATSLARAVERGRAGS